MSYADKVFKNMCKDILENGVSSLGESVRPVWEDGKEAHTIKKFCVVNRYDLSKEFPSITLRKVPIKSCVDEMLWIWKKKSNNIKDLGSHVWDSWADEEGSIGKAYGYQLGKLYPYKDVTLEGICKAFGEVELDYRYGKDIYDKGKCDDVVYNNGGKKAYYMNGMWYMDQVNKVIYDLKNTPFSRRIITNLYNTQDLSEMALYPCAYMCTFNVTRDKEGNYILNMILNQRSQDILAANAWNVCQYAVLLHMIARECNMKVGEFVHVIADCHIYDKHIDIVKELIDREEYDAPTFWLNPEKHDFYSFTKDDVRLDNYKYGESVGKIDVAV